MISKSIQVLRKNPVLILFYAVYIIFTFLILFFLYPKNLSQFTDTRNMDAFNITAYLVTMVKLLIAFTIILITGLLFAPGYGGMISEAVLYGKTSSASFFPAIGRFFARILLAVLFHFAFVIGFSIVISVITVPVTFALMMRGSAFALTAIITSITMVAVIFSLPFILLWLPSIFIDNTGVIQGLKNGVRAGVKNYWKLVLILIAIYVPILFNLFFNYGAITKGIIFNAGYIIILLVSAVISIIILPMLFIIYKESRWADTSNYQSGAYIR